MRLTKQIPDTQTEIRCIAVIERIGHPKFGETCNRFLIQRNSEGDLAGIIKCKCGALYELTKNRMKQMENPENVTRISS